MRRSILALVVGSAAVWLSLFPRGLYSSDGHGLWWTVVVQSATEVSVTISTEKIARNRYLAQAICTIRFLGRDGVSLGERKYSFPVPVRSGNIKYKIFSHDLQGVNAAKGFSMKYRLAALGTKADVPTEKDIEGEVPARE